MLLWPKNKTKWTSLRQESMEKVFGGWSHSMAATVGGQSELWMEVFTVTHQPKKAVHNLVISISLKSWPLILFPVLPPFTSEHKEITFTWWQQMTASATQKPRPEKTRNIKNIENSKIMWMLFPQTLVFPRGMGLLKSIQKYFSFTTVISSLPLKLIHSFI